MADVVADLVAQLRLAVDQASFNRGSRAADQLNRKLGSAAPAADSATRALTGLAVGANQALGAVAARSAVASNALTGLGAAGISSTAALGVGLGVVAVGALASFTQSTARMASAVEEQLNGVRVTFGAAAADVEAFAETASDTAALSERAALQATAQFGGILKLGGFEPEEAAEISQFLVQLAADLRSFKDLPSVEDAIGRLQSGLVGESEPLRNAGIALLSEEAVKAEAVALGLANVGEKLNDEIKIRARLSLLQKQTIDAQGDLERTAGSLANQEEKLRAKQEDLGASLGRIFNPAITTATELMAGAADTVGDLVDKISGAEKPTDAAAKATVKQAEASAKAAQAERDRARAIEDAAAQAERNATATLDLVDANRAVEGAYDSLQGAQQDVAEAQDELNEIVNVSGDVLEELEDAADGVTAANRRLGDAQEALSEATQNQVEVEAELAELLATESERALRRVERATLDLDRARQRQRDSVEDLAAAEQALAEAVASGASPNEIRRRQDAVDDARLDVREANVAVPEAEQAHTDALRQQREGTDELTAAQERAEGASRAVDQAYRGVEDAARGVADATDTYNERLANVGPNSDAAREAQERLDDANRSLADATDRVADSQVAVADIMKTASGEAFTAADAVRAYETALLSLNDTVASGELASISALFPSVSVGNVGAPVGANTSQARREDSRFGSARAGQSVTNYNLNGPVVASDPGELAREVSRKQALSRVGQAP
jgi:chromosome segregation ATPase